MNPEIPNKNFHLAQSSSEYFSLLSTEFDSLLSKNSYDTSNILQLLDDMELNLVISTKDYSADIALLHILAYLTTWDLINLRFLIKRMPVFINNVFVI